MSAKLKSTLPSPTLNVPALPLYPCYLHKEWNNGNGLPGLAEDRYMNFSSAPAIDKKIYDLTAENIRTLSKLSASTGIDCELETNGVLQVLGTSEDMRPAKAYVQQARSLGTPVEFGDEQRLVDTIGTEVYKAAFFDPNGGHIHPMKLVHVSKAAAENAGAETYEDTTAARIEEGQGNLLHTSTGHSIKAKSLVLATNASPQDWDSSEIRLCLSTNTWQ